MFQLFSGDCDLEIHEIRQVVLLTDRVVNSKSKFNYYHVLRIEGFSLIFCFNVEDMTKSKSLVDCHNLCLAERGWIFESREKSFRLETVTLRNAAWIEAPRPYRSVIPFVISTSKRILEV